MDEDFVISKINRVEVGVITRSRRLLLITITETLIILDITKTGYNNCFIIFEWKKNAHFFCLFTDGKQHKVREFDMIILRNHAPRSYMTWLPVTLKETLTQLCCWSSKISGLSSSLLSALNSCLNPRWC